MQPSKEKPTYLHPQSASLHRTYESQDVLLYTESKKKTQWMKWQVSVLSEACSKRYCSTDEELKILETVRDAFAQALDKRMYGDSDSSLMSALGDH